MTKAEREQKRASRVAARQYKLEVRIQRDWDRAIREDRKRTTDRFCRRELGMSLEECIEAVHYKNGGKRC